LPNTLTVGKETRRVFEDQRTQEKEGEGGRCDLLPVCPRNPSSWPSHHLGKKKNKQLKVVNKVAKRGVGGGGKGGGLLS